MEKESFDKENVGRLKLLKRRFNFSFDLFGGVVDDFKEN